jgi:hypothetical protein
MKRSHLLVLATVLALGGVFGESATASSSKRGASPKRASAAATAQAARLHASRSPTATTHLAPLRAAAVGGGTSSGRIGTAPPSPNAAARIRALGLDDGGGPESEDDGGGLPGGAKVAHGSIGSALPSANAAGRIRALGLDD